MPQSQYWPFKSSKNVEDGQFGGESSVLQRQVVFMEEEVKKIQMELAAIKRDRLFLSTQKPVEAEEVDKDALICKESIKEEEELDYKVRFPQITQLREELLRAKKSAQEERFQKESYERKLKDLEMKINNICSTGAMEIKEARKFPNEEVAHQKVQLRNLREEVEEMKIMIHEKSEESQEYRVKYLQAQQQVEELKRQIDIIEYDNKQVSDQIQIEIQKMKMQFQEKLQELAPLPDLLKGAQIQLQEAKQLQKLAEDSSEQLSNELYRVKEKLVVAVNNLNQEKADRIKAVEENKSLKSETELKQQTIEELTRDVDEYKCQVLRLDEKLCQLDLRYQEKTEECLQLAKDLDELRIENNRALARNKERADSMRRYMQTQISELERQLIQTRAQCRTFQKERDDVRQRMQIQINNLQENFELVEMRLRTLHNQVSALKNSYANILSDEDENSQPMKVIST